MEYVHIPHPRLAEHAQHPPAKTTDSRLGLNGRIGVFITTVVGTMWVAYLFAILALVSLPAAIASHNTITIIGWIAQTFLQLVLLPIIIVGQNVQATAADRRSEQTYKDAEAILQECLSLQKHLEAQDKLLDDVVAKLKPAGA